MRVRPSLIVLLLLLNTSVCLQAADYASFTQEQWKQLIPSSTRFVSSLAGTWERSVEGSEWTQCYLPTSETYNGRISYRKQISIDASMIQRYGWNIYFLGLADMAELSVNGQYVGKIFGGMVPRMAHIPEKYLKSGANTIELVVFPASDNALRTRRQQLFGQRVFTGVLRELFLVGLPQISFGDVRTRVQFQGDGANVSVQSILQSATLEKLADSIQRNSLSEVNCTITAEIRDPNDGSVVAVGSQVLRIASNRKVDVHFDLHVTNPERWSPANPALYTLTLRVNNGSSLVDDYNVPLGMVTIEPGSIATQSLLSVNQQPLFLKSIDYVEEVGELGATVGAEQFERDVRLLKTLGVNCLHMLFYAPHPYLMNLCARNGILVVVDMPAYDIPGSVLGTDEVRARFQTVAELMIAGYEHYPSLAFWNVASGLQQDKQSSQDYLRSISAYFHANSAHPVSQTVRFRSKGVISENIDLLIFSADRFGEAQESIQNELLRLSKEGNRPYALSFGKPLQPDNRNGYADPISEEAQARYILTCFRALKAAQCGGSLLWTLTDFQLNHSTMLTNMSGDYMCYSGICNINRDPRTAFAMYKAWLNEEKDPTLQAGTYNESNPVIFIWGGIALILIMIFMTNRSRRFREYVLRALLHPYNFYADIRDQRILSLSQTVTLAAVISCTLAILCTTLLYHARMSTEAEYLLMIIFPQEGIKTILSRLAWSPDLAILSFSMFSMLVMVLVAVVLRLLSVFVRGRIFLSDTYIVTVWCSIPVILFLPFATILFRALDFSSVLLWICLAVAVMIWIVARILRATSVVFDVNPIPVYGIAIVALGALSISVGVAYNSTYSFFPYLKYFFASIL